MCELSGAVVLLDLQVDFQLQLHSLNHCEL